MTVSMRKEFLMGVQNLLSNLVPPVSTEYIPIAREQINQLLQKEFVKSIEDLGILLKEADLLLMELKSAKPKPIKIKLFAEVEERLVRMFRTVMIHNNLMSFGKSVEAIILHRDLTRAGKISQETGMHLDLWTTYFSTVTPMLVNILGSAAIQGDTEAIQKLIDQKCDVNFGVSNESRFQYPALFLACSERFKGTDEKQDQTVQLLLKNGANPMLRMISTQGWWLTYSSVKARHLQMFFELNLSQDLLVDREIGSLYGSYLQRSVNRSVEKIFIYFNAPLLEEEAKSDERANPARRCYSKVLQERQDFQKWVSNLPFTGLPNSVLRLVQSYEDPVNDDRVSIANRCIQLDSAYQVVRPRPHPKISNAIVVPKRTKLQQEIATYFEDE